MTHGADMLLADSAYQTVPQPPVTSRRIYSKNTAATAAHCTITLAPKVLPTFQSELAGSGIVVPSEYMYPENRKDTDRINFPSLPTDQPTVDLRKQGDHIRLVGLYYAD